MIRIEIETSKFTEKHGTSGKGRPYTIREQKAYAYVLDEDTGKEAKYPVKCKLPLGDEQEPYAPGFYTIDPVSVVVGDFDRLELDRVKLVPQRAVKAA